jgi:hypothetical protein
MPRVGDFPDYWPRPTKFAPPEEALLPDFLEDGTLPEDDESDEGGSAAWGPWAERAQAFGSIRNLSEAVRHTARDARRTRKAR